MDLAELADDRGIQGWCDPGAVRPGTVGAYLPRRQWRNLTAERLVVALRNRAQIIERRPSTPWA